jgi:hypothetical protein
MVENKESKYEITAIFSDEGKTFEELMQEIFRQIILPNGR